MKAGLVAVDVIPLLQPNDITCAGTYRDSLGLLQHCSPGDSKQKQDVNARNPIHCKKNSLVFLSKNEAHVDEVKQTREEVERLEPQGMRCLVLLNKEKRTAATAQPFTTN